MATTLGALLLACLLGDSIFSELPYAEALQRSRGDGRALILWFTPSADEKVEQTLQTSWRDPLVVAWVEREGLALHLDIDEHAALAAEHAVQAQATLLRLDDGRETKRRIGHPAPATLYAWLRTPPGQPTSIEDMSRIFEDESENPFRRLDARRRMADRLEPAQTLEHYLWLWHHGATIDPDWTAIRLTFFALDMERLAERHPPARAAFAELLEAATTEVLAGTEDEDAWLDWLSLGSHLDRDGAVATIEQLLARDGADVFPSRVRSPARRLCRRQGHMAAAGALVSRVEAKARAIFEVGVAQLRDWYESAFGPGGHKYMGTPEEYATRVRELQEPQFARPRATELFGELLAAGRSDEARQVAAILLEQLDDRESRVALAEAVLRADEHWSRASAGASAFGEQLAGRTRPRVALSAQVEVWLGEAAELAGSEEQRAEVAAVAARLDVR